jgi:IS605 OrfB family transposase
MQVLTYKFRLKDGGSKRKHLNRWACSVNQVWNYANEASFQTLKKYSKWLSKTDLEKLTAGSSKELGLNSQVIQQICKEYVQRRVQFKKMRLSWRRSHGSRRSLGWIPCTNQNVIVNGSSLKFGGKTFKFWKTREIPAAIKSVSFNEDSLGHWFVNFMCEVPDDIQVGTIDLGVDLGIKTQATLSDGRKFQRENLTKKYEERLAKAQRAGKKQLTKRIHAKIANIRKDFNHKTANAILKDAKAVYVGDVSSVKLVKTNMAKSVLDSGWGQLKSFLIYKSKMLGTTVKEVNESWTTITCSCCGVKSGPSGLSGLSVRSWVCICGVEHDRDINAAKNILKIGLGHQTPIKGIPRL